MLIKFILIFAVWLCQEMVQNVNLLQPFLLILLQVLLENIFKQLYDKKMTGYLDDNLFETDED